MTEENNFNEKIANEDSKLDSLMSVLIILAVTGIIVFWVATQYCQFQIYSKILDCQLWQLLYLLFHILSL